MNKDFEYLKEKCDNLEHQIAVLEQKMEIYLSQLSKRMDLNFKTIDMKIESIDTDVIDLRNQFYSM